MRSLVLGAVLALSLAAPASAAQYLASYSGRVTSGVDHAGVFGTPGADLAGQDFSIDYTLAFPFPDGILVQPQFHQDHFSQAVSGGALIGVPGPLSATITIAGHSFHLRGDYFGSASYQNDFFQADFNRSEDSVYHHAYGQDRGSQVYSYIHDYTAQMLSSPDLGAQVAYSMQPGGEGYGGFRTTRLEGGNYLSTDLALQPLSFSSGPMAGTPAVPEPATWLMLLAGFGALGAMMRRARRVRAAIRFA